MYTLAIQYLSWCTDQPPQWGCHGSQKSHERGSSGWTWFWICKWNDRRETSVQCCATGQQADRCWLPCTVTYWIKASSHNSDWAKTEMLSDKLCDKMQSNSELEFGRQSNKPSYEFSNWTYIYVGCAHHLNQLMWAGLDCRDISHRKAWLMQQKNLCRSLQFT